MIVRIRSGEVSAIGEISDLHKRHLTAGLLAELGRPFLDRLYEHAARCAILLVEVENKKVVGFVMGSHEPSGFYRRGFFHIAPQVAFGILKRPKLILRALSLAKYVGKKHPRPQAELLSIAVDTESRSSGLGSRLLDTFADELKLLGVRQYCVSASDTQKDALKFYARHGGEVISQTDLGGLHTFTFVMSVK